jgi:hypothetical protein
MDIALSGGRVAHVRRHLQVVADLSVSHPDGREEIVVEDRPEDQVEQIVTSLREDSSVCRGRTERMGDHLDTIVIAAYCGGLALLLWGVTAGWRAIGRRKRARPDYISTDRFVDPEDVEARIRRIASDPD